MNQEHNKFWFPAKSYGWGWGLPVKWQGWLVLATWFASLYAAGKYFQPQRNLSGFLIAAAISTILLVVIIALKGEKPLTWLWGNK